MSDDSENIASVNSKDIVTIDILPDMRKSVGERLRHAIARRGFNGAAEFARRVGDSDVLVRAIWNDNQGLTAERAEKYARALGCEPSWLLYGSGRGPDGKPISSDPASNVQADFERLDPDLQEYLADQIARLSSGDKALIIEYAAEMTVTRLLNNLGASVDSAKWYDLVADQLRAASSAAVPELGRIPGQSPKSK